MEKGRGPAVRGSHAHLGTPMPRPVVACHRLPHRRPAAPVPPPLSSRRPPTPLSLVLKIMATPVFICFAIFHRAMPLLHPPPEKPPPVSCLAPHPSSIRWRGRFLTPSRCILSRSRTRRAAIVTRIESVPPCATFSCSHQIEPRQTSLILSPLCRTPIETSSVAATASTTGNTAMHR
jgi:hypothetical protein